MDLQIISLGALDAHPLWNETAPVRTGHATTSLIRSDDRCILIDPGLPGPILAARLAERANLKPDGITHVFLTSFRPDLRRGIEAFDTATWWISEAEREAVGVPLASELNRAVDAGDSELMPILEQEVSLLERCEPAPDELCPGVSPFPLPGVTPGLCGVLLAMPRHTTLVCGDAIPTPEHLEQGIVPRWATNVQQAQESFAEAIEIADLLVLGRGNLVVNPTKRPF